MGWDVGSYAWHFAEGQDPFVLACYVAVGAVLLLFVAGAVFFGRKHPEATADIQSFCTARNTASAIRLGLSFFATSIGAWSILFPPLSTLVGSYVAIITYAIGAGLPVILISSAAIRIRNRMPEVTSLHDYAGKTYGPTVRALVSVLSLVNMGVLYLTELYCLGAIYKGLVGTNHTAAIVFIASITCLYVALGGLLVSMVTHMAQAILTWLIIIIVSIYLAIIWRPDLSSPLPEYLSPHDQTSYGLILIYPVALASSAIFSETLWQRCWSAKDTRALRLGGILGGVLTTVLIAYFSIIAFLAMWDDILSLTTYPFFVPFENSTRHWASILLIILTAVMCQGSIASLQTAIAANLYSFPWLSHRPVWLVRLWVVVMNAPVVIAALQGFDLTDIIFLMQLLCTMASFPVLSGLFLPYPVHQISVWLSTLLSLIATAIFGVCYHDQQHIHEGLKWTFFRTKNDYDYRLFLVAIGSAVLVSVVANLTIDRRLSGPHEEEGRSTTKKKCCSCGGCRCQPLWCCRGRKRNILPKSGDEEQGLPTQARVVDDVMIGRDPMNNHPRGKDPSDFNLDEEDDEEEGGVRRATAPPPAASRD